LCLLTKRAEGGTAHDCRRHKNTPMNAAGRLSPPAEDVLDCDRRLSRAARSLVEEGLRAMAPAVSADASLKHLIGYLVQNRGEERCPLLGDDVGDWHEQHVGISQMPLPSSSASLPGGGLTTTLVGRLLQGDAQVYECLLCDGGKLFSSRYYLDRHQARAHPPANATAVGPPTQTRRMICPATDWCSFLARTACHDRALRDEPFYGPGSGGRRSDRSAARQLLWKQAHAVVTCTSTTLAQARIACQHVADTCFGTSATRDWATHMCGASLAACPHPLQRWAVLTQGEGDLLFRQFHEWQADWRYWSSEHHAVGWSGGLLVAALILYYARLAWQAWRQRQRRARGPRLWRASRKTKVH
jgi:hypothetical protein